MEAQEKFHIMRLHNMMTGREVYSLMRRRQYERRRFLRVVVFCAVVVSLSLFIRASHAGQFQWNGTCYGNENLAFSAWKTQSFGLPPYPPYYCGTVAGGSWPLILDTLQNPLTVSAGGLINYSLLVATRPGGRSCGYHWPAYYTGTYQLASCSLGGGRRRQSYRSSVL